MIKKYLSCLDIPEGKSGQWEIKHKAIPAFTPITVVNMRTAIFSGKQPLKIKYDIPIRYHYLKHRGNIIMSDVPQEQYDIESIIKKCQGNILIGGLGLGYIATCLDRKKDVAILTIIEKSKDVIKLVLPYLKLKKTKIIQEDIFKFLRENKRQFDYIYLDIWSGDNERTLYETVIPLRKLAIPFVKNRKRILCWKEEVMRGQLEMNLRTGISFNFEKITSLSEKEFKEIFKNTPSKGVFWNWIRQNKIKYKEAIAEIKDYVELYGEAKWDKKWMKYKI